LQKFRSFLCLLLFMMMIVVITIIIIIMIHSVVFLPGCVVLQLKFSLVLYRCVSTFSLLLYVYLMPFCLATLSVVSAVVISSFLCGYYFGHCELPEVYLNSAIIMLYNESVISINLHTI
jgi:hypothetical protein